MVVLPLLGPGPGQQRHNMAVTVGLDGTIRRWSLHPADLEDARTRTEKEAGDADEEEEEKGTTLMTEEEERELAELMD